MNPVLLLLPAIALIAIGFALSRTADWGKDFAAGQTLPPWLSLP